MKEYTFAKIYLDGQNKNFQEISILTWKIFPEMNLALGLPQEITVWSGLVVPSQYLKHFWKIPTISLLHQMMLLSLRLLCLSTIQLQAMRGLHRLAVGQLPRCG